MDGFFQVGGRGMVGFEPPWARLKLYFYMMPDVVKFECPLPSRTIPSGPTTRPAVVPPGAGLPAGAAGTAEAQLSTHKCRQQSSSPRPPHTRGHDTKSWWGGRNVLQCLGMFWNLFGVFRSQVSWRETCLTS